MKTKILRTLAVLLAALAVCVFAYPDDLFEADGSGQGEMVLASVQLPTVPGRATALPLQPPPMRLTAPDKNSCSLNSEVQETSVAILSLSSCVLRC